MSKLSDVLGATLLSKEGNTINEIPIENIAIKDRVIGLLFTASWCTPCNEFLPKLIEWYKVVTGPEGKVKEKLSIIFISSDENQAQFEESYNLMPWCALYFSDRSRKNKITDHYSVAGIPSLIFIEAETGAVITKEGRSIISDDPTGAGFPWRQPKIEFRTTMVSEIVFDKDGNKFIFGDIIKGKFIGLFFSGYWCPPCKRFTPRLLDTYNSINTPEPKWEILFISLDRNEEEYNECIAEMPWKRMLLDTKKAKSIARRFFITGIPGLVMLDDQLNLLNLNARTHIELDIKGEHFPWKARKIGEMLTDFDAAYAIAHPSIIYSIANEVDNIAKAKALLEEVAEVFRDKKEIILNFYYYCPDKGESGTCHEIFSKAIKTNGTCILFDAKNNKKFEFSADKINKNALVEGIEKYIAGNLQLAEYK